jgi:hypothetical protein
LQWDSAFDPTYQILEIEQENEIVKAKIFKIDIGRIEMGREF